MIKGIRAEIGKLTSRLHPQKTGACALRAVVAGRARCAS
jgi:hypothetical protein